jgi:hypothetical protein
MTIERIQSTQVQPWSKRTDGITLISIYHFAVAGFFMLGSLALAIPTLVMGFVVVLEDSGALIPMAALGFVGVVVLLLCLLHLVVGYGLWKMRGWARTAALALAIVSLFGFPIFTVIGALTLWYLLKPEIAQRFE